MFRRRTSADSDGLLIGDRRFGFRQDPVPGVEANPTTILKRAHNIILFSPAIPPAIPLHDY